MTSTPTPSSPWPLIGQGRYRYLGFPVYDAWLFGDVPPSDTLKPPLHLEVAYLRKLRGADLVATTVAEIGRLFPAFAAQVPTWQATLEAAFPDVVPGSRIAAIWTEEDVAFQADGRNRGRMADPAFALAFFGIWLDPRTQAPTLRQMLLGQG
jgi:hypothetical protein